MSTDVIMPQMGESIAEGTVTKWLKQVGDHVKRDEALFEISTDKVDAEIPSPAEGVLLEILVNEGETVEINTVVARIGEAGEAAATTAPEAKAAAAAGPETAPESSAAPAAPPPEAPTPEAHAAPEAPAAEREPEEPKTKTSPVVRKIAEEHGVDVSQIDGTGAGGRVTKKDILDYIERSKVPSAGPAAAPPSPPSPPVPETPKAPPASKPPEVSHPAAVPPTAQPQGVTFPAGEREVREKMSIMRKKIAEHMIMSRKMSAHVQTWQECDMSNVVRRR
ncbi:MAG: E3 binding domain-containing protein, partial [bacterium]